MGARVLVVDAQPRGLAELCRAEGHVVTVATEMGEGTRLATGSPFDLILIERVLGDADGIVLLERVRGNGATASTPVVVVSRTHDDDGRLRALEAGADDYVDRPYARRELALRMAGILRRRMMTPDSQELCAVRQTAAPRSTSSRG